MKTSVNVFSAVFEGSAPNLESCPDETLPEFAFIGRSNVGKSSLLNMLAGKDGLARVSPTPGFTKLLNFFVINRRWRLVDLPGYGYSRVARKDSARFNYAVNDYLRHRPNLCCVFVLIDSSLPPQDIDVEFLENLVRNSVPLALVFTKLDRISPARAEANIAAFTEKISPWFQMLPEIFSCSAVTGKGRADLLAMVERSLAGVASEDASAPSPEAAPEPEEVDALPEDFQPSLAARRAQARDPKKKPPKSARPW